MRWLVGLTLAQAVLCAVLGIDFGAEYTKSALVAPNIPFEIILTQDSKRKDTSGLLLKPVNGEFERVYGTTGHALVSRFPQAALYYLKSLLGVSPDHADVNIYTQVNPGVQLSGNKRQAIELNVAKQAIPVEEAVAMSFTDIKRRATELLNHKFAPGQVTNVVVAIPGHFSMNQRRALVDAIDLAGLDLIALIDDGVAVAVNYASTRTFGPEKQYVAVYDMGADSTTSTLVSLRQDGPGVVLEVESFGYDRKLGGHSVTRVIRDLLVDELARVAKVSSADLQSPRLLNRLWREAERAKAILSANTETRVHVESAYNDLNVDLKIARAQLEAACGDLVSRVTTPLSESLTLFDGTQLSVQDLDSVILAGGATRAPFVQAEIRKLAGDIISKNVNADEAACMGATLRGVGISGIFKSKNITVVDRTPFDYTLMVNGEKFSAFPKGTAYETEARVQVPAGDIEKLDVQLLENGEDIMEWSVPAVSEAIPFLEESSACLDDPVVELKLQLNHNRIVRVASSAVKCTKLVKKVEAQEGAETTSDTAGLETRVASRYLVAHPKYPGTAPLSASDKQALLYHLSILDKSDLDRERKEGLHHELESLLYRLREWAPHLPDIHELVEWVEEGTGTLVQYAEKLAHAKRIQDEIQPKQDKPDQETQDAEEPSSDGGKDEL